MSLHNPVAARMVDTLRQPLTGLVVLPVYAPGAGARLCVAPKNLPVAPSVTTVTPGA